VSRASIPTRQLSDRPDLDQLKRQAKELLDAFAAGAPAAVSEVEAHYRGADRATFALHDAQLILARAYGFDSWPKLKAYVDGVTVRRFRDAVIAGDRARSAAMLSVRPELGHASIDNLQVLHHAVLNRSPEMVRLLMRHDARARDGVYPHRDATSPLTIAIERGYEEIVAIIEEEELRQRERKSRVAGAPEPTALFAAIASGADAQAIALMEATPALVRTCHAVTGMTPLHMAARRLTPGLVEWLLGHGAEPRALDGRQHEPLDWAAYASSLETADRFAAIASMLTSRGAGLTAAAAVVLGDVEWLRTRHAAGSLTNPIEDAGGLLRIAATHDRADVLALLLDMGFDPDERVRVGGGDDLSVSSGMPLAYCAGAGKYEMAELLLTRGANPNASIDSSGDPVFRALSERDGTMVALLERHGGVPTATSAGLFRQTVLAKRMLAGDARYRLERNATLAEELRWGAACGGDPEIVRLALDRVDWPREDARWFEILEQPLRMWAYGSGSADWDRTTYLECFRQLLARCDPDLRGRVTDRWQFGLTILHGIAGSRSHLTSDDRAAFAAALLDAGARLDLRDGLLKSTPLGWACRWGRVELVSLFLERGADALEPDAEPWATPEAWAAKTNHTAVLDLLQRHRTGRA
jgi:ankyrin repeat protein